MVHTFKIYFPGGNTYKGLADGPKAAIKRACVALKMKKKDVKRVKWLHQGGKRGWEIVRFGVYSNLSLHEKINLRHNFVQWTKDVPNVALECIKNVGMAQYSEVCEVSFLREGKRHSLYKFNEKRR